LPLREDQYRSPSLGEPAFRLASPQILVDDGHRPMVPQPSVQEWLIPLVECRLAALDEQQTSLSQLLLGELRQPGISLIVVPRRIADDRVSITRPVEAPAIGTVQFGI